MQILRFYALVSIVVLSGTSCLFAQAASGRGSAPSAAGQPIRRSGGGPYDWQVVDPAAAQRGKALYAAQCVDCHGPRARGTERGADLVRSVVVLHDRFGNEIGPFLKKGHPTQSGQPSSAFTNEQVVDLSNFLHQSVDDTLRTGPYQQVLNVLTGNAEAGKAYFNGAGKCNTCHSPSGDLAGIATRYTPPNLQQRFLFPNTRGAGAPLKPTTVTVTLPSGDVVSGVLDRIDDFDVSVRDASGNYHSFKRTPDLKVEVTNPYAFHEQMLSQYTDRDIHNVVAYLETLK